MLEVKIAKSNEDIDTCHKLRKIVFIKEQNVSPEEECDEQDKISKHFILLENNTPIGTGRIYKDNSTAVIGRICILKEHRGKNAGLFLMKNLIDYCKNQNFKEILLGAQEYALGFYEKSGFQVCSERYMDANIPHFKMKMEF